MIQNNTQYMSEPARAERAVRNFANVTLRELRNERTKKYMDYIMDTIRSKEYLVKEKVQDMTYMELACLIDSVGGNSDYDGFEYDSFDRRLGYYKLAAYTLMDKSMASIPVRMFLALPLKAFYGCLNSISPGNGLPAEFEAVRDCCDYTKDYTVKDFLAEKIGALNKAWAPVMSFEWYKDNVIQNHEDIGRLLIDSFHMAFPDSFHAESICKKYRKESVVKKDGQFFYAALEESRMKKDQTAKTGIKE